SEVCIAAGGKVWLFRGSGECLPGWPQQLPHATQPSNPPSTFAAPAVGDIDADGVPEILLASNACQIHAWTISGSILDGWPAPVPHQARAGFGGVALGDVTGDGRPEIVITSEHGFSGPATVTVLDARGRPVPNWPYHLPDACNAGAALGDLTGDGILEIVIATVGGDAAILAIDGRSAQPLPGWPRRLRRETVNATPLIVDLDGDGWNDILVAALSTGLESDTWIWAFDKRGQQLDEFPIMLPQDEIVCAAPVTVDLDGDGDLELLAATERLNSVYVWDLNTLCDPSLMPWPAVAGGASRRGCPSVAMDPGALGPGTALDDQPPGAAHNLWPPEEGAHRPRRAAGLSTVAFDLRGETHVRLVIFDIKRHPIRQLLQHTLPPGQYRIYWDGRDAAGDQQPSGIYFYQLNLGNKAQTRQLLLLK
ncbi:MAG: VCBS repeat-containing protein, partial [Candidatus Eisenbacteria sp.]|nr:VCBS repeat-containing protein [Candidatus Eisenbacteria bacterium]